MTDGAGQRFGLLGPLAAFPLRIAAREAAKAGHHLHRGVRRQTSCVVVGRKLLDRSNDPAVAGRIAGAAHGGRRMVSEAGFLRLLGLAPEPAGRSLDAGALLAQSGLRTPDLDFLRLFDAFECDEAPYTFRDLILARKYAGLIAEGATATDIARSVGRAGPVSSLAAKSLRTERQGAIYARYEEGLGELCGQLLFDLGSPDDTALEDAFAHAETAEAEGRFEDAAAHYARCLAIDPRDAVAAFNRGNCLRALGCAEEAASEFVRAMKVDPGFVEALFNLADLMGELGRPDAARRHLRAAIERDPAFADAVFNLARLEFEAGALAEAKRLWKEYLKLDAGSEWAQTAMRGIQYVDLHDTRRSTG